MELCKELVTGLYPDAPPKGTYFQFGEDLARRYNVTSFVDFNGKLERFLKRFFTILYPLAILIYINISLVVILYVVILTFSWATFLRPVRILRALLRLR